MMQDKQDFDSFLETVISSVSISVDVPFDILLEEFDIAPAKLESERSSVSKDI